MLLFQGIKFSKMKCFIDIIPKIFTNIWINIVKKKYSVFPISSSLRIQSKNARKNSCQASHKEHLLSNILMVQLQKWPFFQLFISRQYRPGKCLLRYFKTKKKPFQAIKRRSSNSRKIDIFPKGLTKGFGPKMAIFATVYLRQYRPGKCLLRYSRTKKHLSRL